MRLPGLVVSALSAWLGTRGGVGIGLRSALRHGLPNSSGSVSYLWENSSVHVRTVDTRTGAAHCMDGAYGAQRAPRSAGICAGWDTYIGNLGAGRPWQGLVTKVRVMRDWLEARPVPAGDIVVFVDGDVIYGGCALRQFKSRLSRILRATNASIVFGVEAQCNDYSGDCWEDYPAKFYDRVLREFSLDKMQMQRSTDNMDEKVGRCRPEISPRRCSSHHELKFLNSGFYAGHAARVLHALKLWLSLMESPLADDSNVELNPSDQSAALVLMEQFPGMVALDYAAVLCANLYGLKADGLFEWNENVKSWFNSVNEQDVCFIHPNGKTSMAACPG